jgi:hypothetical protein
MPIKCSKVHEAGMLMKNRPKSRKRQRETIPTQGSRNRRSAPARKGRSKSTKARLVPVSKLSERAFAARDRSLHALRDMRQGASISQAARNNGVTTRTIKKYFSSALLQDRLGGRIRATKSDRFIRYLQIPGLPGETKVHGLKEASEAARFKADVNGFLRGDSSALEPWHGKKIAGVELVTDGPTLKGLAKDHALPYSLYRSLSGGA